MPDEQPDAEAPYREILTAIVKRFIRLVGAPAALSVAHRIRKMQVDAEGNVVSYDADNPLATISQLIEGYGAVFGEAAIRLSQQAAGPIAQASQDAALQEAGLVSPSTATPIELMVVDDHALFRDGLISLLAGQPDMKVVGQAGSVREAVALATKLKPAVVLMDIGLPDGSGIEATRAILATCPTARIMFLTVHEEDELLFAAIRAGAVGYLFKNVRAAELLKRLRDVAAGEAGLSPAMARRVLEEFAHTLPAPPADQSEATALTTREIEVVRELAHGATNREIAARFVISENTVKNHVRSVLSKLHLRSRRDVAGYARNHGLNL